MTNLPWRFRLGAWVCIMVLRLTLDRATIYAYLMKGQDEGTLDPETVTYVLDRIPNR
jgi:hypothetical protein